MFRTSTILRRMNAKDDRFSAEQRRKFPHLFTPRLVPVVGVALEPNPDEAEARTATWYAAGCPPNDCMTCLRRTGEVVALTGLVCPVCGADHRAEAPRPVVDVTIVPAKHLLQPGDLPAPLTLKERRAFTKGEAEDVRRRLGFRPNDAHRRDDFDRCTMSKFGTHRFVANCWTSCEFCGRNYKDCLVTK